MDKVRRTCITPHLVTSLCFLPLAAAVSQAGRAGGRETHALAFHAGPDRPIFELILEQELEVLTQEFWVPAAETETVYLGGCDGRVNRPELGRRRFGTGLAEPS